MSILDLFLSDFFTKECNSDCTFPPLAVGDRAVIALPSNPSTGYSWSLNSSNSLIEILAEDYVAARPRRIGSGGVTKFPFLTLAAGTAELEFVYQRPFSGEVAKRIKVKVPIKWARM